MPHPWCAACLEAKGSIRQKEEFVSVELVLGEPRIILRDHFFFFLQAHEPSTRLSFFTSLCGAFFAPGTFSVSELSNGDRLSDRSPWCEFLWWCTEVAQGKAERGVRPSAKDSGMPREAVNSMAEGL